MILIRKLGLVLCSSVVGLLTSCGGGGGGDSNDTPAAAAQIVRTYPLRAAYQARVAAGAIDNFSISGTCSGTATTTASSATPSVFEGVAGFSVAQTATARFVGCSLRNRSVSGTAHYDSAYSPVGSSFPGVAYQVFSTLPSAVPVSAKVGDAAEYSVQTKYTDSTKTVSTGKVTASYVIEADATADTALALLVTREYDVADRMVFIQQARYRITSAGTATLLSIEQSDSTSFHLVWTWVSSGVGGLSYTPASPPVANALASTLATAGTRVLLIGDGSTDADGDPLTYIWTLMSKPAGSATTLALSTAMRSNMIVDVPGTYTASLVVNDGTSSSAPVSVSVVAMSPCCLTESEPNNSSSNNNIRAFGVTNVGALSSASDLDWYYISNDYLGMVQVDFELPASAVGFWNVSVRAANGSVLSTRNISAPGFKYEVPVTGVGTMSVIVQPTSAAQYGAAQYAVRLYAKP